MKINAEQFEILVAKLDWLISDKRNFGDAWNRRVEKVDTKLAAIEQGQGVLCERLDALRGDAESAGLKRDTQLIEIQQKLDAIQGALLLRDFKKGARQCRKSKSKKR